MQKAFHSLLVALVAVLALVGCGKSDKGGKEAKPPPSSANGSVPLSGNAPVDIVNFEFKPQKVVVKPGTRITWSNEDTTIHDIKDTSPLNTPPGKELSKGDTFSVQLYGGTYDGYTNSGTLQGGNLKS